LKKVIDECQEYLAGSGIMEKSLIYVMSLVRSAPGNRIKQEELTDKVSKDISQKKGAYIDYSESYRMTRFNKDISELISKGFLHRTDATLEMPYEAVNFFDKLPKPFEGVKETIYTGLYELLNTGQALKLDILRLMIEEADDVRDGLKSLMWSEKAVESALTQLSMDDVISLERKPKLKTEDVKIEVKKFFDNCRDNALGLSVDKRNESERLEITLPKYRRSTSFSTSPINVATLLIDFANELRTRKVEILSTELNNLRLAFNQKLYEITYKEEELFDLPHFATDRALFLSDRIHPVFIKNFCGEYNAENRNTCAVYNLKTNEKFNVT
jgi:hypothetical protein